MKTLAVVAVCAFLVITPALRAQEAKPATQDDVAALAKQVKALQTTTQQLQKMNEELQSKVNAAQAALNTEMAALNQKTDKMRADDKAVYDLMGQWKSALEGKIGGHFLVALKRDPSGQLVTSCCWGTDY